MFPLVRARRARNSHLGFVRFFRFSVLLPFAGRGAPKVALRFTSGVGGFPELASAEAFVEFEKEVGSVERCGGVQPKGCYRDGHLVAGRCR